MYQVPLRFIKIGPDMAICATRIVAAMSMNTRQAMRTYKMQKGAGTLLNACGRNTARSIVFLDNGTVIASPITITRIITAIQKADHKNTSKTDYYKMNDMVFITRKSQLADLKKIQKDGEETYLLDEEDQGFEEREDDERNE